MAVVCPKCGALLKPFSIRTHFKCPSCAISLKGQIVVPIVITILVWQIGDLFLYPLIHFLSGSAWPSILLRSLLSLCIGLPIYALLVARLAKVEIDQNEKSEPGAS
jgi:hypothetical protein